MRKSLLLFLMIFIGFTLSVFAKKVELNDAKLVGKNFFYERINRNNNVPFTSILITGEFVEKVNGLPVYYIFNFKDKGFIIIAADDEAGVAGVINAEIDKPRKYGGHFYLTRAKQVGRSCLLYLLADSLHWDVEFNRQGCTVD